MKAEQINGPVLNPCTGWEEEEYRVLGDEESVVVPLNKENSNVLNHDGLDSIQLDDSQLIAHETQSKPRPLSMLQEVDLSLDDDPQFAESPTSESPSTVGRSFSIDRSSTISQSTIESRPREGSLFSRAGGTLRSTFSSFASTYSGDDILLARLEAQNQELKKDPKHKRITQLTRENVRTSFLQLQVETAQRGSIEEIDWDFWELVVSDFESISRTQTKKLSDAIQEGVPSILRGMIWKLFARSKEPELEMGYAELIKQQSPFEKIITRELELFYPTQDYFKEKNGNGQRALFNLLSAYSLIDDEVGYSRGIGFIAGLLLLVLSEEEAFCLLSRLMKEYDLRSHFTTHMDGLQQRLFQFEHLMEEQLTRIHRHLTRLGIKPEMYALQWLMTLFADVFPLSHVYRIFDVVIAEGLDAVFRFALAILKRSEIEILGMEFEQAIAYLKGGFCNIFKDPDDFIQEAYSFRITPKDLLRFSKAYQAYAQRAASENQAIESLRIANAQLSAHVKNLEGSLAKLNREHCDLANMLISAKMELASVQERRSNLRQQVSELTRRIEEMPAELDAEFRGEIQNLAQKNADLVGQNCALETQLNEMESMLIDTRVRFAESESERELLRRRLGDMRRALGVA
ncbi:uncharacterized protein VTP21DRAFT_7031 [Calcarisporiella thermophila]|uniref:uncharacterized protein n=1 Tax=Calcarisporiella thermophila TaxID=911321 RepID=UPI0037448E47